VTAGLKVSSDETAEARVVERHGRLVAGSCGASFLVVQKQLQKVVEILFKALHMAACHAP
jgi:hypothetical protein